MQQTRSQTRQWLWRYLLLGLVLLLVLVIAKAPASLMATLLQNSVPGVSVSAVKGSFWKGEAGELVVPIHGVSYSLGATHWRIKPWRLLTLQLCLELRAQLQQQSLAGQVCINPAGEWHISDSDIAVPVAVASLWLSLSQPSVMPPAVTLPYIKKPMGQPGSQPSPVSGLLAAHITSAVIKEGRLQQASGTASWQQARLLLFDRWLILGSYSAQLQTSEDGWLTVDLIDGGVDVGVGAGADAASPFEVQLQVRLKLLSIPGSESRESENLVAANIEHQSNEYKKFEHQGFENQGFGNQSLVLKGRLRPRQTLTAEQAQGLQILGLAYKDGYYLIDQTLRL